MPGKPVNTGFLRILEIFCLRSDLKSADGISGFLREKERDLERIGQFIGQFKIGVFLYLWGLQRSERQKM